VRRRLMRLSPTRRHSATSVAGRRS
jgi:hypothetical protein